MNLGYNLGRYIIICNRWAKKGEINVAVSTYFTFAYLRVISKFCIKLDREN